MGCVFDESDTDEAECSRKMGGGRKVANAWSLQLKCARVLHEPMLVPALTYGSETMIWREERSKIRDGQPQRSAG